MLQCLDSLKVRFVSSTDLDSRQIKARTQYFPVAFPIVQWPSCTHFCIPINSTVFRVWALRCHSSFSLYSNFCIWRVHKHLRSFYCTISGHQFILVHEILPLNWVDQQKSEWTASSVLLGLWYAAEYTGYGINSMSPQTTSGKYVCITQSPKASMRTRSQRW